jgi:hypothetical protein
LIGGQRIDRFSDDTVLASERLGFQVGMPGALSVISNEPVEKRVIQCQTAFGAHVNLNDYTGMAQAQGLPGHAWTDSAGRVEIHVPSNEFGRARSYGCWAPDGVPNKPPPPPRQTTHAFISSSRGDLDLKVAVNGHQVISQVWCAAGTELSARLALTKPAGAAMNLIIADNAGDLAELPVGASGLTFPSGSSGTVPNSTVRSNGSISFALRSAALPPEGVPFELECSYFGTKGL